MSTQRKNFWKYFGFIVTGLASCAIAIPWLWQMNTFAVNAKQNLDRIPAIEKSLADLGSLSNSVAEIKARLDDFYRETHPYKENAPEPAHRGMAAATDE